MPGHRAQPSSVVQLAVAAEWLRPPGRTEMGGYPNSWMFFFFGGKSEHAMDDNWG